MLDDKPMRVETSRWRTTLYLAIPPVLCTVLYWNGLNAWFQQDDFAWLGLSRLS